MVIVQCDGSSLKNPGPSGAGIVVRTEQGSPIVELSIYLGKMRTNNEAEYLAIFHGIQWVLDNTNETRILIQTDSQLVLRQLRDEWATNDPKLRRLKARIKALTSRIEWWKVVYQHWLDTEPPHLLAQHASKTQRDSIQRFDQETEE